MKEYRLLIALGLFNNFNPSITVCNTPQYPTFVGPVRNCTLPNNLRSNRTRKATLSNIISTMTILSPTIILLSKILTPSHRKFV